MRVEILISINALDSSTEKRNMAMSVWAEFRNYGKNALI